MRLKDKQINKKLNSKKNVTRYNIKFIIYQ